eukprot:342532_1
MAEEKPKKSTSDDDDTSVNDFEAQYMELALKQAVLGRTANEVPVGCVVIDKQKQVIASAHNETNQCKNGTKHCEIVCIDQLARSLNLSDLSQCCLYVTVEPCVMCASALKIFNIGAVFYGCCNHRFGGNGSVYSLNGAHVLGFPAQSFGNSYRSIKVGGAYEKRAIDLLKTVYESGNEFCPSHKKRARMI